MTTPESRPAQPAGSAPPATPSSEGSPAPQGGAQAPVQTTPGGKLPPMDSKSLKKFVKEKPVLPQAEAPKAEMPKPEAPKAETPKPETKEAPKPAAPSLDDRIGRVLKKFKQAEEPKGLEAPKITMPQEAKQKIDELMAEGKYSESTEIVQAETARQILSTVELRGRAYDEHATATKERERANAEVYKRHPELLEVDEATLEGKKVEQIPPFVEEVRRVYEEYPEFLSSPRGPLAAVDLAEKRIKDREALSKAEEAGRTKEAERSAQALAASSLATSAAPIPEPPSQVAKLSDSQRLVAMKMGIGEDEYAAMSSGRRVIGKDWYQRHQGLPKRIRR